MSEQVPTFCALCVSRCGALATVEDGRLTALETDPLHPTGAALCIFVDRISGARGTFEEALESLIEEVAEVRVAIAENDVELEPGQPYHVAVYFVVDETTWNTDAEGRAAIYAAFGRFVGGLAACEGVEVDEGLSQVIPGSDFTWQATRSTDEWNFANLSHREQ